MKPAALLPLLMFIPGCQFAPTTALYLAQPSMEDAVISSIDFDPVRTITLKGGRSIDVLKFGADELLEIKCPRVPVEVSATGTRLFPIRTKAEAEDFAERAAIEMCALDALRVCRQITQDERSTFGRVTYLIWYGKRHVGPAIYVQCMTAAEFRALAVAPIKKRIDPLAAPKWEEYLREIATEEAKKHSNTEQAKP